MVQSSTFTSIPAGMIVVPAKQFGPAAWEGEEKDRKEGMRTTRNGRGSPESFSFSEGLGWTDAKRGWELGGVRADVQIFSRACTDGLVFATLKRFC